MYDSQTSDYTDKNIFEPYSSINVSKPTGWHHIYKQKGLRIAYHHSDASSNDKLLAFKYMPYDRFVDNLEQNEFVFVSPFLWRDPFETLFYKSEKVTIDDVTYDVRAACFVLNDFENEEGLWFFSPFGSEQHDNPTVRVSFDMVELLNQLDNYANKNDNIDFYLSIINYKDCKEIFNQSTNYSPSSIDDYISKLSLKRNAYKHEIELRLFAIHGIDGQCTSIDEVDKLKISDLKSCVAKVTFPPIDPMNNGIRMSEECYHKALQISNKTQIDRLEALGITTGHSQLYDLYQLRNQQ